MSTLNWTYNAEFDAYTAQAPNGDIWTVTPIREGLLYVVSCDDVGTLNRLREFEFHGTFGEARNYIVGYIEGAGL